MRNRIIFVFLLFIFSIIIVYSAPSDDVAEINGTYYKSLALALNSITDSTKTTIVLVKDRQENITIKNYHNIVLDLNEHTLYNSGDKSTVVTNNGKLEIKNGTITSDASSGIINNNANAILVINGGSYIATGSRQVLYNNGGNLTISGDAYIESNTSERAAVHNLNNGTLTILNGTIVAKNAYGVYNEKGNLNIGTKNDEFDKTTPTIQGKTYGLIANNKYNFYDGTIKGATYHVGSSTTGNTPTITDDVDDTKLNEIEEDSEKVIDEEDISETTYKVFTYNLDNTNRITITFDPNGGEVSPNYRKIYIGDAIGTLPTPNRMDHLFDGWFTESTGGSQIDENTEPTQNTTYYAHWTYVDPNTVAYVEGVGTMSLEDAIATGGNIRLEKDVIVPASLVMNKETTFDLNGHTLSLKNNTLTIKDNVTITDSSSGKTGKITSTAPFSVIVGSYTEQTNAHLVHEGGTIEGLGTYGAIRNYETLEINGGTVEGTTTGNNGYVIYNEKTLIMNSGTVHSTNGRAIQVYTNATFEMNGGLVTVDTVNDQAVNLYGNCSAVINGGTIDGSNYNTAGIAMFGNTNLTVNGGTIRGGSFAIAGNGSDTAKNANITINDGNLISLDAVALYLPQQNSLTTINGGNITGAGGIEIRAGKLIVNDGNIVVTSDTYEVNHNQSGSTTKGIAIAVAQHSTKKPIEVIIDGGNYEAPVPLSIVNPANNPPEALELISVKVKDGDFESTSDSTVIVEDTIPIDPFISGGTFNIAPIEYLEEGYRAQEIPEGYIVVDKYFVTVDPDSADLVELEKEEYKYKEEVILKNLKDKEGYNTVVEVYDTNGNNLNIKVKNNKFNMPDADIVIKITYKKIVNPLTGDNIFSYLLILLISTIGLIGTNKLRLLK